MAGLLESDLVKFLAAPRAFYRDKQMLQAQQQFQGLLGSELGQQLQGPTQPGQDGLLGLREPTPQFWLKAASIPGYEGLAGQQLGITAQGGQRMAEQQAQNQWESQNLTAAQLAQLGLQQQRGEQDYDIAQQNLARQWYGTQASAGAANASADLSRARLGGEQQKQSLLAAPLYQQLPPAERLKATQELFTADTWAQSALDVADWIEKRAPGSALPAIGTAEADAFNTEWQSSAKPAFMQILNTGVLQGKEAEEIADIIGQPADKMLTKSQINVIKTVARKVQDLRGDRYKALGLQAPAQQVGGSAVARTLNQAQPQGAVRPVSAIPEQTPTIWNQVQRY